MPTPEPDLADGEEVLCGGDALIPRQLNPLPDGSLAETCPEEALASCGGPTPFDLDTRLGKWLRIANDIQGENEDWLTKSPPWPAGCTIIRRGSWVCPANMAGQCLRSDPSEGCREVRATPQRSAHFFGVRNPHGEERFGDDTCTHKAWLYPRTLFLS
jgi:hypothetical protein